MRTAARNFVYRALISTAALVLLPSAASAQVERVLHNFAGNARHDGNNPRSGLVSDTAGALYGTTEYGGTIGNSGAGTVFQLTPPAQGGKKWIEKVIYSFLGANDGNAPFSALVMDKTGTLFGTTNSGGTGSQGTVFSLTPPAKQGGAWKHRVLYNFCSQTNCIDGAGPVAGLVMDNAGALYGTTQFGGNSPIVSNQGGTAFRLSPPADQAGAWTETVLYNFCTVANCTDGWQPFAPLLLTAGGTIYGTTAAGGNGDDAGTVFALVPSGGSYTETVLHAFGDALGIDGRGPYAGVVADKSGVLYGTTNGGGANGCGTVYSLSPAGGNDQVLYAFCAQADHSDGALPSAGLVVESGKAGTATTIYGTTTNGKINGVVFKLVPGGPPWKETVLHSFCSKTNCVDGSGPEYGTLLSSGRSLFGTTFTGGKDNSGTVFEVRK